MESIYDHGSQDIRMVIVGHKADLQDERAVTTDEGKKVQESSCNKNSVWVGGKGVHACTLAWQVWHVCPIAPRVSNVHN